MATQSSNICKKFFRREDNPKFTKGFAFKLSQEWKLKGNRYEDQAVKSFNEPAISTSQELYNYHVRSNNSL